MTQYRGFTQVAGDDFYAEDPINGMTVIPAEHGEGGVDTPDGPRRYPQVKVKKVEIVDGQDHVVEEVSVCGPSFADGGKSPADHRKAKQPKGRAAKAQTEPAAREGVKLTQVKIIGPFGTAAIPCERVFQDGNMLVLVTPPDGAFISPPASDETVIVSWAGRELEAYPVDVAFQDPSDGRRFMVLITG
jgi:hypothetical protein